MPLLAVHNLKKSFVTRVLFEGVSFEVDSGDHIGFVGVNGCGKSTLFRILLGEESADEGNIYISGGTVIGSMSQTVSNDNCSLYEYVVEVFSHIKDIEAELDSVNAALESNAAGSDRLIERQHRLHEQFAEFGGATYASRTRSTLLGLGFTEEELNRSIRTFSGGQRNKAQLAKLLLSKANLLLLDEPTNHLDIGAIEWLEGFLGTYKGSFIVISHDRYFLDRVTNRTIELKDRRIFVSKGNYSRHLELRSTARELEMRQYLRTKKEIKRIEGIVEQQRRWGQERNFVTAASKQKQADRLKATLVAPERDSASIHFAFTAKETGGNDVLVAKKLAKRFDSKSVFQNASMLLKKGEKVFLLGDNGCGKTTLLNILSGHMQPSEGSYYLGSHIESAYYEQTMTSLNPDNTVLNEVWDKYYTTISHKDICNALAAFLFRGEDVDKPISLLSGGEMARVQLLKLMLTKANLLLLDEPTNHLDIASREALEAALEEYDGTMLIVTHDRYLVNRLADRVLHMTPNGLKEYIGGYDDYLEALSNQANETVESKHSQSRNAAEYRERKAQQSAINRARGETERCEAAVAKAEAELSEINEKLAMPYIASDYKAAGELSEKADALRAEIEKLYSRWEEAETKLSELCAND
ncbi:MAG: ABC-F family ATP-binding cassette domain-containing protein [Christensenellaceae bacterium]|nr:ABC-F family ATP-binding cassette domain-containing protein [Christensenellaceae bacterium]